MNCKHCGSEFEAKRSTAQYCGSKCKVGHARTTDPPVSVTEPILSVTDVTVTKLSVTEPNSYVSQLDMQYGVIKDGLPLATYLDHYPRHGMATL